ncbi:MAG: dihydrodipicolinate synthase family protein [Rhizobiales bacterium]|nr:dihydrodipicolinate synthase family protein [Hyphomicrobiales bacterium]
MALRLPTADGRIEEYRIRTAPLPPAAPAPFSRIAFSAAHVVADPLADADPWTATAIDWERTIAFRHHLWDLGLGVAEAMDTAQRGMGLGWREAEELIRRSLDAAKGRAGALIACGAGTDHLDPAVTHSPDAVIAAYEMQFEAIERLGGRVIMMASRALARAAKGPEDYARVYDRLLAQASQPVIVHWLGDMFDPQLAGYWGTRDLDAATATCLAVIAGHVSKVDGIKVSLLSKEREIAMRRQLPAGVRMYTGDDFNYAELIAGENGYHSDALLGIFDAIAPAAAAALGCLAAGDRDGFDTLLAPTVPLSRHIFKAPTWFYKTGIVYLAYLNGFQDHFRMIGGQESARSLVHLAELFRLADAARVLADPDLASERMRLVLALGGVR